MFQHFKKEFLTFFFFFHFDGQQRRVEPWQQASPTELWCQGSRRCTGALVMAVG
jgi:hypothetical protein